MVRSRSCDHSSVRDIIPFLDCMRSSLSVSFDTRHSMMAIRFTTAAAALAAASALMVGNGTVYKTGSTYSVTFGVVDKTGVAYGSYKDLLFSLSAFGQLNIETNAAFDDNTQMYALGYLEGALTWERIHQQVRALSIICLFLAHPPRILTPAANHGFILMFTILQHMSLRRCLL